MKKPSQILVGLSVLLFLLSRGHPVFSQPIVSPSVVASVGSDTLIGNTNISYTVGESVITTLTTGTNYVTQGFQQPDWLIVSIPEVGLNDDIKVFPNPSPGMVNIQVGAQTFDAVVYDLLGKVVIKPPNISGSTQINLEQLAPATYVLVLTNSMKRYSISLIKLK